MKKFKLRTKIALSALMIVFLVMGIAFGYTFHQLSKITTTAISKTDEDLGIKPKDPLKKEESADIVNIALFGLDRRSKSEPARSDSIMVLSIDKKHNKIKMSSIMRDTYVKVKGHGETKINHAYAYGGPQLAIRTLNENFDLDIRNFVAVDFFNLEALIDAMGGVSINVSNAEIPLINQGIAETAAIEKKAATTVKAPGTQSLNGMQAVAYSRIRYLEGGDFVRTERQRTVLSAMIAKMQSLKATEMPDAISNLLPYTETSMNSLDLLKLGTSVVTSGKMPLVQERFPIDGYCIGKTIDSVWYLVADMNPTIDQLHKFIYDDIKPIPKAPKF